MLFSALSKRVRVPTQYVSGLKKILDFAYKMASKEARRQ